MKFERVPLSMKTNLGLQGNSSRRKPNLRAYSQAEENCN